MKLSMWIIADWLTEYCLELKINKGSATISGFRFFTETLVEKETEVLYIGKASEVFTDEKYQSSVLLVHRYDMIIVRDQSVDTILNELLKAHDHFNRWESALRSATVIGNVLQQIVDLCYDFIGIPVSIVDGSANSLALSEAYESQEGDYWASVKMSGHVPLDKVSNPIRKQSGEYVDDWETTPNIFVLDNKFTYIGTRLVVNEETVAFVYLHGSPKNLTQGDVHLASVLCEILYSAYTMWGNTIQARKSRTVFVDLLGGREVSDELLDHLEAGFKGEPPYLLISIRQTSNTTRPVNKALLLSRVGELPIDTLAAVFDNDVVVLMSAQQSERFFSLMARAPVGEYYTFGVSLPFSTWQAMQVVYRQTQDTLLRSGSRSGIYLWEDYAFSYALSELKRIDEYLGISHPAIEVLRIYDAQNGTELLATLRRYLEHECNVLATSKSLFIHRNTLTSRLERIRSLIPINYDDPQERVHLLVSSYLTDAAEGKADKGEK